MAQQTDRKRDKIKRLFQGSRSITPDPSANVPSAPNRTTGPTRNPIRQLQVDQASHSRTLWESALEKLSPDERSICDNFRTSELSAVTSLLSTATAKQEECGKHQWTFKFLGKHLKLRDLVGNIADYLKKFQEVGDTVASFDPVHAALPWAAVKSLLQVGLISFVLSTSLKISHYPVRRQ